MQFNIPLGESILNVLYWKCSFRHLEVKPEAFPSASTKMETHNFLLLDHESIQSLTAILTAR